MKPAPFDYQAPATLREAIDLLASDPEATVIAGGQSLMPVLAFRLATPSMLADLRLVPGLGSIAVDDSGVRLAARVRWRDIEDDQRLQTACAVTRRRFSSGCKAHPAIAPAGSNRAGMEETKCLKPPDSGYEFGDCASVQAATQVNAVQSSKMPMCRPTR